MHKVIKISGKILLSAILFALFSPLVLSLLLAIPAVQNFAIDRAAAFFSKRLETTVSIGHIQVGLAGSIRLHDFYVEDYQHDTLLYVGRLRAFLPRLGLTGSGLRFTSGELTDPKLFLRETPSGEMNIKQLVSRLTNPDREKKGNFRLSFDEVAIRGMELRIERLQHRDPAFGIDYGDMRFRDGDAQLSSLLLEGPAISMRVGHLSLREQSGLEVQELQGGLQILNGRIDFDELHVRLPNSELTIPTLTLAGESWEDYKQFVDRVQVNLSVSEGHFTTDEAAYFAPALQRWQTRFGDLRLELSGRVSSFDATVRRLTVADGTSIRTNGTVKGLPDWRRTHFDLRITQLRSTAREALQLAALIGNVHLPAPTRELLLRTGKLDLSGRFTGTLSHFDAQLGLATSLGSADGAVKLTGGTGSRSHIDATVTSRNFRLGALLDREPMVGNVTVRARFDGTVGRDTINTQLRADLTRVGFNDYVYDTVRFDGRLRSHAFDGRISVIDSALQSRLTGLIDWRDSVPRYDVTVALQHADLHRLNFNRRDSVSQLSARIVAKASGRSADDLNGVIRITNADYRYNDQKIHANNVVIEGANTTDSKYVALRSDFADIIFRSRTGYAEVYDYLRRSAWRYLPLTDRSKWVPAKAPSRHAAPNDFSLLEANLHHITPIVDALSTGLQVADGSTLKFLFNPADDQLSLNLSSEYIERNDLLATRLSLTASNRRDSLTFYASAEDFYAGLFHLPRISVTGGARLGRVQLSAGFADTVRNVSARLGMRAEVVADGPEGREIDVTLQPSHLTSDAQTWQLGARGIRLDSAHVHINRFVMRSGDQSLTLDGTVSREPSDSLTFRMHDFEVGSLLRIAERMGYNISGRTNGEATMSAVLGEGGRMTADVRIDSLAANGLVAPPLRLVSAWSVARSRAALAVTDIETRDTLVRGFYAPDTKRYYAALALDDLDMGLLDPILSGVISGTKGAAKVRLEMQGEGAKNTISGSIGVRDFATTVDYTQVRYTMPEASLAVADSRMTAREAEVFDRDGNRGLFDLDLNLQKFNDIAYQVRLRPEGMLVLDTQSEDNELFYGRIFASGDARIDGRAGETDMRITATTDDNSLFYMPLSDNSNLANTEFVTFVAPPDPDSLDVVAQRRRRFEALRRRKEGTANRMRIELTLNVQPNLEAEILVAGSPIKTRGEGLLNLVIDPSANNPFELFGDYRIREGSYDFSLQNLISKKFVLQNGSMIQWTGVPTDARLDIEAVYKLRTSLMPLIGGTNSGVSDRSVPVECVIRIGNRLTNPTITFDVQVSESDPELQAIISTVLGTPESVDLQFLYLLLFNSFMAESSSASNANLGASASAATGLEFLANQLSRLLSADDYNLVIRYRPRTDVASDEVDFGLSRSLIDNRLYVEVEGNYLIDSKQAVNSSMSSFMGEAYVTYLIDRAGTLKLKAFTQTIDRFDENQGLQETGIGIYYKEDFDNLRDLLTRIKERFKRRDKKEKKTKKQKKNNSNNQ